MAFSNEQKLQQALKDVQAQKFSLIRAAAKAYNVDHSTLGRRHKGGVSKQNAREPQQLLSQKQEELLI